MRAALGRRVPPNRGWHLSGMFEAMERGELTALYVIGENPLQSEADRHRTERLLRGLDFMVVQDIFLTATAEIADVVLPAAAAWSETEGTVTNCERRVQRVRKAMDPPGEARDDLGIIYELARRLGPDWGEAVRREDLGRGPRDVARPPRDDLRAARGRGRAPVAVLRRAAPGRAVPALAAVGGPGAGHRAPFVAVDHDPPVDKLDDDFPIRLTTGRRLESYNTGVQSGGYNSPLRSGETLDLSPEDVERGARRGRAGPGRVAAGLGRGAVASIRARRGSRS